MFDTLIEYIKNNDSESKTKFINMLADNKDLQSNLHLRSFLIKAIDVGNFPIYQYILTFDIDINFFYQNSFTPLHLALVRNHLVIAEDLITRNKNLINRIYKDVGSALHLAIRNGQNDLIDKLLKNGANPNLVDQNSQTPLFLAIMYQQKEVVKLLLAYKANPFIKKLSDTAFDIALINHEILFLLFEANNLSSLYNAIKNEDLVTLSHLIPDPKSCVFRP